jgi:uncharacterized membrane protein YtjA (UPF0391 family)
LLLVGRPHHTVQEENEMLRWALTALIVALVAAVFGYGGVLGGTMAAAGVARILFVLCLGVFVISLVLGLARRA